MHLDYFVTMTNCCNRRKLLTRLTLILIVISLSNCSIFFKAVAPFSDLPEPTGPYGVGTRSATWIDSSRDETFTPERDYRKIVVQVWFPIVKHDDITRLPYIDDAELRLPAIAKQLGLPLSLIKHFDTVRTNASATSSGFEVEEAFPVILFSHGLSGMRFQNSALIEELVSYGYIVLAPDHSYGANITIFDEGEPAEYEAGNRRSLNADFLNTIDLTKLYILVDDLRFILDQAEKDSTPPLLQDIQMDTSKIGVMGHSLGAAAAINTMAIDKRIRAAMILDGWYSPVPDSIITRGLSKPVFHLGQKEWSEPENYARMDKLFAHNSGPIYKLLIPGTFHTDFTDMPLFTPFSLLIGYTKVQDPIWLNNVMRRNTLNFFTTYLKGQPRQELHQQIQSERGCSTYIFYPDPP